MKIKKGNTVAFQIPLKDSSGVLINNLIDTEEIYFMLKEKNTDSDNLAIISKKKSDGGILIDTPSEGYIEIPLSSEDTDIAAKKYYIALELQYPNAVNEINLFENSSMITNIEVVQDIIRG